VIAADTAEVVATATDERHTGRSILRGVEALAETR